MSNHSRDYVLGTHDGERERLKRQHAIWRQDCLEGWHRAGFGTGQRLLDLGCGPGFATVDLAALVGPAGHVLGIDNASRYVAHLHQLGAECQLPQLEALNLNLADPQDWLQPSVQNILPADHWHGAWFRWLAMFLPNLAPLLDLVCQGLRSGGRLVLHEYVRWDTFTLRPNGVATDRFVQRCSTYWRSLGGDPDVASRLPALLEQRGLQLLECRSLMACSSNNQPKALWLQDFLHCYPASLQAVGMWSAADQQELEAELSQAAARPSLWITPALLEMIWHKP